VKKAIEEPALMRSYDDEVCLVSARKCDDRVCWIADLDVVLDVQLPIREEFPRMKQLIPVLGRWVGRVERPDAMGGGAADE
jgi:hypothetical protein